MPERPRSHQLEDESRIQFRLAVPKQWVVRDIHPDYGLDIEVEVFGADNRPTGHLFKVQVKATDDLDITRALSVRLPVSTLLYYASLEVPVLLVLYHAPTSGLFVQWTYAFELHLDDTEQKTVMLRMTLEDEWAKATPTQLLAQLVQRRSLQRRTLDLPFAFTVLGPKSVFGVSLNRIVRLLQDASDTLPGIAEFATTSGQDYGPTVDVADERTVINFLGTATATVHHEHDGSYRHESLWSYSSDIFLGLAILLGNLGYGGVAARIIIAYLGSSTWVHDLESVIELTQVLVRAHHVADGLRLADTLLSSEDGTVRKAGEIMRDLLTLAMSGLARHEQEQVLEMLRKAVVEEEQRGDSKTAAIAHYNLANNLRALALPVEALQEYDLAAQRDPDYLMREYFHRERAGVLFGIHRYGDAADEYRCAHGLRPDVRTEVLCADALLYAGQYAEALEEFDRCVGSRNDLPGEWKLKRVCARYIVEGLGLTYQTREREIAEAIATVAPESASREILDAAESALAADALCARAWVNMYQVGDAVGWNDHHRAIHALLAAVCAESNGGAWCVALLAGLRDVTMQRAFGDIAATGHRLAGKEVLGSLDTIVEQLPPEAADELWKAGRGVDRTRAH